MGVNRLQDVLAHESQARREERPLFVRDVAQVGLGEPIVALHTRGTPSQASKGMAVKRREQAAAKTFGTKP